MLFYIQALTEQTRISKNLIARTKKTKNEKMIDVNIQQKGMQDVKRKIIGKVMLEYTQLQLLDPETNLMTFKSLLKNENIKKLIEGELKYAKTTVDYESFLKDIINSLDQMMFLRRVNVV